MPCMKCSNGKWKYGAHGSCVFDTLAACKAAAAAIHIQHPAKEETAPPAFTSEDMSQALKDQYS